MDPQGLSPPPLAVQCQFHAGQPFTAVCQRCGTYMCALCTEGGRYAQCAACRERTGTGAFPFDRNSFTFSALFDWSWRAYKQHWAILLAGLVISGVVVFGVSGIGTVIGLLVQDNMAVNAVVQIVNFGLQLFLQGIATLGLMRMAHKAVTGQTPELSDLWEVRTRIGTWVVQFLAMSALYLPVAVLVGAAAGIAYLLSPDAAIWVAVGMGLLMVPVFIYVALGMAFGNLEIAIQPNVGAVAGLRNSWAMAQGKRSDIFLCGLASFGLYIAGFMACFVGALFSMGLALCLFCSLYAALRNGTPDLRS